MTTKEQRQVEAQKIVEGSPIGIRTPDIISGLSLKKLIEERKDLASNYNFAIDAMRTTQRLFNLSDRHLLMQACLNMEATAERFEKLMDV